MNYNREYEYGKALRELFGKLFTDNDLIDIPEPVDGVEAALEYCEAVTRYNEGMWAAFLDEARQDTAEIQTSIDREQRMLTLKLREDFFKPSFYDDLQINFILATYAYEKPEEEFDFGELDGMSRDEAIDYLSQSVEIPDDVEVPEVEYLHISSSSLFAPFNLYAAVKPLPNTHEMASLINHVKETLLKIPEVLAKVDEEIKAKEDEEKKKEDAIKEIEENLRPALIAAGWEGEFCVIHFTKDLYKLYLRVGVKQAYNVCATIDDILDRIPNIVQISKAYMDLMSQLADLGKEGFAQSEGIKEMRWNK
ncbi:MAG: hypothetical protein NC301_08615 [Bacteroides sp.]|nr:hypothetical protein [Alistipes timonensis]MCM1311066.1 hypothetical protein [Bacteroides sp.]MCM1405709.1 hypothetical protein [[Clostridium] fimetarium]